MTFNKISLQPIVWRIEEGNFRAIYLIARTRPQATEVFFQIFPEENYIRKMSAHAGLPLQQEDPLEKRIIACHVESWKFCRAGVRA
jgi:hypothetical protein